MRLPVLIGALAILAMPAVAEDAEWHLTLTKQMESEYRCKTEYLSHITERRIGERYLLSAKVHCEDKRTFDANWDEQAQKFQVRRCGDVEAC